MEEEVNYYIIKRKERTHTKTHTKQQKTKTVEEKK